MSTAAAPTSPPALPLAAAAVAAACFVGMDATAKLLSQRYDVLQVTFLRFASGSLFAVPLWLWFRTPLPPRGRWPAHALRSVLLLGALLGWFHGLTLLPLAQAVAVSYTAPLFISLLAMTLLRERPSRWIWAALGLGALGVVVALWPQWQSAPSPARDAQIEGQVAAALAVVCYSGVVVLARHQAQRDALWTISLLQNLLPALALTLPLARSWRPLQAGDAGVLLLLGLLATVGLMGITWAFARIEASRAAPMEYTGFAWAALLGYTLFGEVPSAWTLAAVPLIVGGCLLLLRR